MNFKPNRRHEAAFSNFFDGALVVHDLQNLGNCSFHVADLQRTVTKCKKVAQRTRSSFVLLLIFSLPLTSGFVLSR